MHKTYTMHFPIKTRKAERKYHMEIKTELETYLKCTDEASTEYFKEGDKVICYAGGHKYDGKIKAIGGYSEETDTEPIPAIYLDTSPNKTSYSAEVIKIKDITSICKNPLYKCKSLHEEKGTFRSDLTDYLIKAGFGQEEVQNIYDKVNDAIILGCLPTAKASAYALHAAACTKNDTKTDEKDTIIEIAKECSFAAVKEYFDMIDVLQKAIGRGDRDKTDLIDVLHITSKCWHDLLRQEENKTSE